MTGFQIFLCVVAGIILFFILVLSIPFKVSLAYEDKIHLSLKYLFIKLDILPIDPNKPKKEKKAKEKKPKPEKPKQEKPQGEKKPSPILEMVKANGYDGMMAVIGNLFKILGIYGGKIFKSIKFNEIDLYISVGTGDAASTAIKYGETCQKVYPVFGFICNNNVVKKYDVSVEPDFLANTSQGEFYMDMDITLRKIINATLAMVFRLIFKVAVKFFIGGSKKKSDKDTQKTTVEPTAANNKSVN